MLKTADVCVYLPVGVSGLVVSYTASSSSESALPGGSGAIRWQLQNRGTDAVHYIVGVTGVGAAVVATCRAIGSNETVVYDAPHGLGAALYIRVIGATTTGTLYVDQVA
jgi:hypothetical protein